MSRIKKYNGQLIVPGGSGSAVSVTSTISEIKVASILIPANTFRQYDIVGIEGRTRKSGTNGVYTMRFRVNTSDSVGGVVLGVLQSSLANNVGMDLSRRFVLKTATGTGSGTEIILNSATAQSSDIAANSYGYSNLAIDWTQDQYVMMTIQLSNTSDIGYFRHFYMDFPEGDASVI